MIHFHWVFDSVSYSFCSHASGSKAFREAPNNIKALSLQRLCFWVCVSEEKYIHAGGEKPSTNSVSTVCGQRRPLWTSSEREIPQCTSPVLKLAVKCLSGSAKVSARSLGSIQSPLEWSLMFVLPLWISGGKCKCKILGYKHKIHIENFGTNRPEKNLRFIALLHIQWGLKVWKL